MSEIENLIQSDRLTLIDVYGTWCSPCIAMNPIISELSSEMVNIVDVVKVDVDTNKDLAIKYGVRSVPTFILFRGGEILWKQSGTMTKQTLVDKINEFSN